MEAHNPEMAWILESPICPFEPLPPRFIWDASDYQKKGFHFMWDKMMEHLYHPYLSETFNFTQIMHLNACLAFCKFLQKLNKNGLNSILWQRWMISGEIVF